MDADPATVVYRPSGRYELQAAAGRVWFVHRERGGRVETDRWGERLFSALPAGARALQELLAAGGDLLALRVVDEYLEALARGGIVIAETTAEAATAPVAPTSAPGMEASVVVVSYRGRPYLEANLQSLRRQTIPPSQVIVVDNASADGTVEWLRQDHPAVEVVALKRNLHYAGGVNRGVERARGEWVLILNQDVELADTALAELLARAASAGPEVAAVVPQLRLWRSPEFLNGLGNFVRPGDWGGDDWQGLAETPALLATERVASACFGAVLVRRAAWAELGGLDEGYRSYYEDMDWSLRARGRGLNLLAAPRARVYHHFSGSYPAGQKLYLVLRNRLRFILKNFSRRATLVHLRAALRHGAKLAVGELRRRDLPAARRIVFAHLAFLAMTPAILVRRLFAGTALPAARMGEYFAETADARTAVNELGEPVLSLATLRRHYRPLSLYGGR